MRSAVPFVQLEMLTKVDTVERVEYFVGLTIREDDMSLRDCWPA